MIYGFKFISDFLRVSERIFLFLPLFKYQICYEKEVVYEETNVEEDYKYIADRVHAGGRSAGDADAAGRGI